MLNPGTYSISELVTHYQRSRSSIERDIKRLELSIETITKDNKPIRGVVLTAEKIEALNKYVQVNKPMVNQVVSGGQSSEPMQGMVPLTEFLALQERLINSENEKSRLSGELYRMDEVIKAKSESIEALKAAMFVLESKSTKAIEFKPVPEAKPGFIKRIKSLLLG